MVSMRLLRALREQGVDARMLVVHKSSDSPSVEVAGPKWRQKLCFMAEHLRIFCSNGFSRSLLFQASIASCGLPLSRHPWVMEADVVVLAWINQGMLSLSEIARIKAPVVWVMHDMWCMTGVCHHAAACTRYMNACCRCPILGLHPGVDLSTRAQRHKAALYDKKKIHFVAVSNWLLRKSRESALLSRQEVSVIPNVFPLDDFTVGEKTGRIVVMGAARLDDPVKGLGIAVKALNMTRGVKVIFFGSLKDKNALSDLKIEYEWLGPIRDAAEVARIYSNADVVLSTSHYETLPGTLIEGMAAGCVPVTFGQGGQDDIVDHLRTGYIAQYPSAEDIAAGISWALASSIDPGILRRSVSEKFASATVAERYIDLFNHILS